VFDIGRLYFMEIIKSKIFQSEKFGGLIKEIEKLRLGDSLNVKGVRGSVLAFLATRIFENQQCQILLIASDEDRAEKLRDDCAVLAGEQSVRYFGALPAYSAQLLDVSSSIAQVETLKALASAKQIIVVASPDSIIEKVSSPEKFNKNIIDVKLNQDHKFQKLIEQLEQIGFERKNFVESYGDFAVRGGIVDVFPYVGDNPIRFEFWGDTVESIREFDVVSQRSIQELKSASIVPSLATNIDGNASIYDSSLFDYLSKDAIVIFDGPEIIKREIDEQSTEATSSFFNYTDIVNASTQFRNIINSNFVSEQIHISHLASHIQLDFDSVSQPSFNGSINLFVDNIAKLTEEGYEIFIASDTNEEMKRLKELIDEEISNPEKAENRKLKNWENNKSHISHLASHVHPIFLAETIHSGFIFQPSKIAVFTEHEIFNRLKQRGTTKRRRFKGFSKKEFQQLKRGDYVVHVDHGIGEFAGLTKINIGGVEHEAIRILFLEKDTLYVNLNFIDRVQKYSSQEGHIPKLTRLGSPDWERMKSKAKRRIKDIARDLISLYAKRKNENGISFSPDSHWQKELEASFMYEDTIDQTTATLDVKRDMESSSPMDRLICGDVGFGKTEVAVRAAFKAVMDGKQVAILVPTTILAVQHYNTFLDRLNRYTTKIESLTRFKSKKDQNRIIEEMKKGSIDIVIGTHRLLSKDIGFKDLGLLIIDEEHRFGVSAKEKLRQIKANVDTLTLTATPIPRTLHFSLIGARDLSLINTPPRNRLPIITEIITASDGRQMQWHIVRDAIRKELHRGGQVYFVHDRVQNIDVIADQVKSYVSEARVHVAHGQMTGHQLEKTMLDFLEKKYDILIATKIIESGLDIPNVNTIIINRADRFGLAELYQLRGRVGRTNIQAYAYLLVPPVSILPKHTLRRLTAIEEFTELGSGFNLAMRDLEIRGAGNLLGAEQSGFIMDMGFEMYERIVRESVEELKQEEFSDVFKKEEPTSHIPHIVSVESIVDADIDALIPDFYIESDTERLDIYRRLYRVTDTHEIDSMRVELKDRFGEYPEEVENLFQLIEVRMLASRAGFPKVSLNGQRLAITLPDESNKLFYGEMSEDDSPFNRLIKKIATEKRKDIQLKQTGKELTLRFDLQKINTVKKRLDDVKSKIEFSDTSPAQ
jgi:transcription-repair coupling factor (superfamily II helicase)